MESISGDNNFETGKNGFEKFKKPGFDNNSEQPVTQKLSAVRIEELTKKDKEHLKAAREKIEGLSEKEKVELIRDLTEERTALLKEGEKSTEIFRKDGRTPTKEEIQLIVKTGALLGDKSGYDALISDLMSDNLYNWKKRLEILRSSKEELGAEREKLISLMGKEKNNEKGKGFITSLKGKFKKFFGK